MPASEARRQLDFTGVLAALQERLGTSVTVSVAATAGGPPLAFLVGELISGEGPPPESMLSQDAVGFGVGDTQSGGFSGMFSVDPALLSEAIAINGVLQVELGAVRLVISEGPTLKGRA